MRLERALSFFDVRYRLGGGWVYSIPAAPVWKPVLNNWQLSGTICLTTAAFSDPAPFTFGDAGRDIIPGRGNEVIDLALHRRFIVAEGKSVEFRWETFNTLNHPNLGIPGRYPDFGPFFGKAFSVGDPRRMQFALRFDF